MSNEELMILLELGQTLSLIVIAIVVLLSR